MNDEGRRLRRRSAPNSPARTVAATTALQEDLLEFYATLARVRERDQRTQAVFGSIIVRTVQHALALALVIDEAEGYLREAA